METSLFFSLQGWNASLNAGFPPIFPGHPFQTFGIPPPGTAMTVPPPAAGGLMIPPVSSAVITSSAQALKPSPIKGIKGLNALLGLPTPSEEPAPPGTVVLPDGTQVLKKRPASDISLAEDSKDGIYSDATGNVDSEKALAEKAVNEQIQKAMHEQMVAIGELDGELGDQTGEGKRQYRFAWDEDIQEVDLEVGIIFL
jgi:hypothetical protein